MKQKLALLGASFRDVAPLNMTRPAAEQICSALRAAILNMQIRPGALISENEVGQVFGASRTPVREAFAQLREDGLIMTWPSRGTYVSKLSEQQIIGAQFLREALESAVVERLCTQGLSQDSREKIRAVLESQRIAVAAGEKLEFQQLDDRFHLLLAEATGFERIGGLLLREKSALDRLRVLSLNDSDRMGELLSEHEGIFNAIQSGDKDQAFERMRQHLRRVLATLSDLVAANRDFFEESEV